MTATVARPRAHRFPFDPVLDLVGGTLTDDVIAHLGVPASTIRQLAGRGLTAHVADLLATRLGRHPADLWPDWWDHVDDDTRHLRRQTIPTAEPTESEWLWEVRMQCRCGAPVEPVAEGGPTDGGTRMVAAVICELGHRSTLIVTLEAA